MTGDRLVSYPYVKVRISCALCQRVGVYRLARLAAHYGAEIELDDLLTRLVPCPARNPCDPLHRECQVRYTDLDPPMRPPDQPQAVISSFAAIGADLIHVG
jgi:hypothetical protein